MMTSSFAFVCCAACWAVAKHLSPILQSLVWRWCHGPARSLELERLRLEQVKSRTQSTQP
ncbi:hypothetical protein ACERK3_10875 [Phycisphaerales bacterium AB-hyl4]|uniref:Uncharacterized protein n=1 Tax=Natronomicrosphaera hydrolytica TaxID=3242702 RepID=A0ABV4U7K3_9BACT